jgi:3-oxoadipate enol-lactonase
VEEVMPKKHIRDIDIYYEDTGQGKPLLLIHGLGSSTSGWAQQVPEFSKKYRVIAFDVRGHGQSDKPRGPYSIPLFAEDTSELITSLGISPTHIVGISMGGAIALQLAVDYPETVKSLVIVNMTSELIIRTFKERLDFWMRTTVVRLLGMRKMGEILAKRLFPKPEQEEFRRIFPGMWAENDKRAYLASLNALVGWSVTDRLGTIKSPTLVIAADEDYSPVSAKEAYVAKIPNAKLVVIHDSRHATPFDQSERFNTVLNEFLSEHH